MRRHTAIFRATFAEAIGRKLVLWGVVATAAFVGLFGLAMRLIIGGREGAFDQDQHVEQLMSAGIFVVLGLYVASFLISFLSLIVSSTSVTSDIDSGVLQAVVVRPISRTSWYLQRWAALVALAVGYVVLVVGALILISNKALDYLPLSWPKLIGLMALQAVFLISVGMAVSTRLSAMTTGVLMFFYFGFAWLGGFVGYVGGVLRQQNLEVTGLVSSLIAPSDGIWRAASYYALPQGINVTNFTHRNRLPLVDFGVPSGTYLAWVAGLSLLALVVGIGSFRHRDL